MRLNAGPAQCLIYQVTATNSGTGDANDVELRDTTPVYTTFENTPGVLSVTTTGAGPAVFSATPSQGGTGDVIATVGVLQPGDVAVMTFEVEVDGNLPNTTPGAPTPLQ